MQDYSNCSSYFENRECRYYPCHDQEHINCMFCYCPLYGFENCPGDPVFLEKEGRKIKDCSGCLFPHKKEHYEKVIGFLRSRKEQED